MQYKILIVDDDENICELLRLYLEKDGFDTVVAGDGEQAVEYADGWQVCREIRKTSETPIIMLTAKGETFDKILGLELGADDYVSKPFDTKEVIARIKAVLRRTHDSDKSSQINEVRYDKLRINLTNKELELIYHLASNPNRVYTRDQLLDEVWGFDYYGDSRTVDVHVKRLREKLENVSDEWSLKTVWGVGYKFEVK